MSPPLLIGNGLALLVAALELARQGQPVTLLTDDKPLGGHFAGLQIGGYDFDIGMVLLEECRTTAPGADLRSYDPAVRNDWTRFGDLASAWIRDQVDLVRARTPECLVEGRQVPDYLISNRLDGLAGGPSPPPLSRGDPRHAVHKCRPGAYDTLTYAQAAACNHGEAWHQRFIEPFVLKVFGVGSSQFLARFHRAAWVPLYYPETIELAASGNETVLPEYPFWTTPNGFVGQLVMNLRNALARLPNVSMVIQPLASVSRRAGQWCVTTIDGQVHSSPRVAIGLSPERAGTLLGVPVDGPVYAATVTLLFALVRAERIRATHGCTMLVDDAYASYRLTDHDAVAGLNPEWHRIVLEASPQGIARNHPGKTAEVALLDELASLLDLEARDADAIRPLRCIIARDALPIPTSEQVLRGGRAAAAFAEAARGAMLTASLLGYGVASLNDQLIQGLRISKEFS